VGSRLVRWPSRPHKPVLMTPLALVHPLAILFGAKNKVLFSTSDISNYSVSFCLILCSLKVVRI
jgi:hypothetical protein